MLNKKALAASLSAKETDADFKQTVLLLHGDGTNGAQNNTFTDSSTNAFTITRNGNTTQGTFSPFSQTGWSNYFDGTSDYLSLASNTAFNISSGAYTLECFVYFNAVTSSSVNVLFGLSGTGTTGYVQLLLSSNVLYWQQRGSGTNETSVAWAPSPGQWYHIAVGWNGSNSLAIWINGSRVVTNTVTPTSGGQNGVNIGGASDGYSVNGYFSNLRLVKGTDVYGVGNSTITVPTTALTAITNTSLLTCNSNRFKDDSTNGFTITRNGDVSVQAFSPFAPTDAYSAGTNGGSGYFDGTGDYLSVANNTAFALPGDFTLETWIYPTTRSGALFGLGNYASPNNGFSLYYLSNKINLYVNGADVLSGSATIVLNQWTHVALVRSGSGSNNLKLYINGVQDAQATVTTSFTGVAGNGFAINTDYGGSFGSTVPQGYQSSARLVKGTAVYTTAFTPPTAPLTAISGTSLLCNFTNAGIIDQTAKNVLETVGNAQIDTGTKKFGTGSMYFDGTGDYLKIPKSPNLVFGTGDFTIECWIYVSSNPAQYTNIVSNWEGSDPAWILNFSNASGNIRFNDNGNVYLTSSSALTTGQWNHVAVSRSGTSLKMFFNGTDVASATNSTSFGSASSGVFVGAYYDNTYPLTGFIDDLRITKGKARYTANFTAPTKAFADQ